MRKVKLFTSIILAIFCVLPLFASCGGSSAPDIETVRADFEALINASFEINDIFFGQGLPVYDRETSSGSGDALYDEAMRIYYWLIDDAELGSVLKIYPLDTKEYSFYQKTEETAAVSSSGFAALSEDRTTVKFSDDGKTAYVFKLLADYKEEVREIVYDDNSPVNYDYVRLDAKYQRVQEIKEAAEKVYTSSYLNAIYSVMFDGVISEGTIVYARYMSDESGNTDFLLKSNRFDPYFETQTTYDLSSMKIIMPSTDTLINVEIEAVGRYIDKETLEIVTGPMTKTLRFIKNDAGEWRLDTPTY